MTGRAIVIGPYLRTRDARKEGGSRPECRPRPDTVDRFTARSGTGPRVRFPEPGYSFAYPVSCTKDCQNGILQTLAPGDDYI